MNFTGSTKVAQTINGSIPGPLLRWREGDTVTLRVANQLRRGHVDPLARHPAARGHGRRARPELSRHPAGRELHLPISRSGSRGTYWYHSHSGFQEQRGRLRADRHRTACSRTCSRSTASTSCCCRTGPTRIRARVFARLKKQSDYYNFRKRTRRRLPQATCARRGSARPSPIERAWGAMRMNPTDLADVGGGDLHLPDERRHAGGQLDRPVRARRARAAALHQRLGDDLFRRAHSRAEDDGGRRGRPARASGDGGRVPHRASPRPSTSSSNRRDRTRSRSSRRRWTAPAMPRGTLAVRDGLRAPVPALDPRARPDHGRHGHGADMVTRIAGHGTTCTRHAPACSPIRATETGNPLVDMQATIAGARSSTIPGIGLRDNGRRGADLRRPEEHVRRPRRPRARTRDRAAPDRAHGAVRLVVRRPEVLGRRAAAAHLRRAAAHRAGQRHDDDPPDPSARDVERPRRRRRRNSRSASTPSTCRRARGAATASRPTRSGAGPITAICSTTWKRACSAKCGWQ